ncbi:OmpA family protein [Acidisoma cellulosilytica]|uniref:OmpA family protein n=1 Tax=Acidisoma cellulosilyticum TaxID=2802395 RepID=A0A964E3L5_9PROT|nr:OmpA family protein [Acidisoma cellulosilyticum]MCB8880501.1 OmpA family protein [Acidisoma cellulosilyticum]
MKLRSTLMAATVLAVPVLALPTLAKAQPVTGLYVGAGAGYDYQGSQKVTGGPGGLAGGRAFYKGGVSGSGSIGYGLGNGLRLELEGIYLRASNKNIKPGAYGPNNAYHGYTQKYGAFANALYDIDVGSPYFYPYIGAGVGYLWTAIPSGAVTSAGVSNISDTKGSFAYQGIAGFSVPIPPAPGLSITAEYHYIGTTKKESFDSTYEGGASSVQFGPAVNQTVLVGLRYAFNTPSAPPPPPAPMVAPAPAPARTYLVFFDWDKYNLTPRAKEIIAEAASNSTHVQYTQIAVNGYTDTSGTASYNMGLSIRRAKSVQAQLIADGVPASAISIAGYGDTHLLVPTGPGVREPQNRRVEIIIK